MNIDDVPTEILDDILSYVAVPQEHLPDSNRARFPFNVASTCQRWYHILRSRPRNWQHIIIDVADDPAPFLDVMTLHDNADVVQEITVFSSLKECQELDLEKIEDNEDLLKVRENSRAQTIFTYLEPTLFRYNKIAFDLVFQSSLPSATKFLTRDLPNLFGLSLRCSNYDFDDEESPIKVDSDELPSVRHAAEVDLLRLTDLSLTGYAFMELAQLGTEWIETLWARLPSAKLSITHFKFHKAGRGKHNNTRTIYNFMALLSDVAVTLNMIQLSDLTVNYHPTRTQDEKYTISVDKFICESVSREFLQALFSCVAFTEDGTHTSMFFTKCSIPPNVQEIAACPRRLSLSNIPFSTPITAQMTPNGPLMHPHLYDDSLYNALSGLHANTVLLRDCEGVTDELLEWLSEKINPIVGRKWGTLLMVDCPRFTSAGVRAFIAGRAEKSEWFEEEVLAPLTLILVSGENSPPLMQEDKTWLSDRESNITTVIWDTLPRSDDFEFTGSQ